MIIKKKGERNPIIEDIMGRVPPWVVRWGISVVFIIVILLLSVSMLVKYPENINVNVRIYKNTQNGYYGKGIINEKDYINIRKGMRVIIKLRGYPYIDYGIVEGIVSEKRYVENKGFIIKIKIGKRLKTSFGKGTEYYEGMSGVGEITIKEYSLLRKILKRNKIESL